MRTETNINTHDVFKSLARSPYVASIAAQIAADHRLALTGANGSSAALLTAAIASSAQRPALFVTPHLDDADNAVEELLTFGVESMKLAAMEVAPGESHISVDLFAERLSVIRRLLSDGLAPGAVLVCSIHALMQMAPTPGAADAMLLSIQPGQTRSPQSLVRWLDAARYQRVNAIEEPGDFAIRGGIIDIFPAGSTGAGDRDGAPVRLDFFGDEVESVSEIDLGTMGSDRALDSVELIGADMDKAIANDEGVCLLELLPPSTLGVIHESLEIAEQGRGYYERLADSRGVLAPHAVLKALQSRDAGFIEISSATTVATASRTIIKAPILPLPETPEHADEAIIELASWTDEQEVLVVCENEAECERLHALAAEHAPGAPINASIASLQSGFIWTGARDEGDKTLALIPYHELLHRFQIRRRIRRMRSTRAMDTFLEIKPGDYVVHADHGVAKFIGLSAMRKGASRRGRAKDAAETPQEYLTLEFSGKSRLHVPATQIDKVQKYIGGFKGKPPLSTLGGARWRKQKEQVQASVRDLAAQMLRIQAAREHSPGVRYPDDTVWQHQFEAEFPYEETEDQLAAMAEIKRDMQSPRPMDRLVCGDVGYGKTELAIRAAFKAAEYGKQIAILVPTTILAEQHEHTFRDRFADYPFRIESISRFKTKSEQRVVIEALSRGEIDIIIGTHRLLSKDVQFADLGLVVIDEEQRFGVEHKQRLLSLRMTIDVLTLTATPIPRTLHMSLLGLRDISSLTTAPLDRRAIITEVVAYDKERIRRAIARELNREGQVFFVHNRVKSIHAVAEEVQQLAPGARLVVGHGQLPAKELERVMLRFIRRQADILVCTTIIESGVDIPTANTIIISDADRYGLADLHQLRGRVGRHKHRAYCSLLLPQKRTLTPVARRRLAAIEEFNMLGSGFKIAMRDLEIRGAGNLLGVEQSGHIAAVGYEMYCQLLERAVHELRNEPVRAMAETTLDIGLTGVIPKPYIPSDARRMEAYRRLCQASSGEEIDRVERDLTQAYGEPPGAVRRLLILAEIRAGAQTLGVRSITVQAPDVILRCGDPSHVVAALQGVRGTVRPLPPKSPGALCEVYFRPPASFLEPDSLANVLRHRLSSRPIETVPV